MPSSRDQRHFTFDGSRDTFFSALATLGLFVLFAVFLYQPVRANDLWWHMAAGRYIAVQKAIPRVDPFSLVCGGRTWIDFEWLYERILYELYDRLRMPGVILLKIFLVLGACATAMLRLLRARVPWVLSVAALLLIFYAGRYGWIERADLITVFFTGILMCFLEEPAGRRTVVVALGPPFFYVWANLHPGFILGLLVLAIRLCCEPGDSAVRRWRRLGFWIICALATQLTPYGVKICLPSIHHFQNQHLFDLTDYALTPWRFMQTFWAALALFWVLLGWMKWKGLPISCFCLASGLLFTWMSAGTVRLTPLFLVAAFPLAFIEFGARGGNWPHLSRALKHVAQCSILLSCIAALGFKPRLSHTERDVVPGIFPLEACHYIERFPALTRFYNDYNLGSYWVWHFAGKPPVFIDGRAHTVDGYASLYEEIRRARTGGPRTWEALLDRYRLEAALMTFPTSPDGSSIYARVFPSARWALVYWDDLCLLYVRRTALPREMADQEFRFMHPDESAGQFCMRWQAAPTDLKRRARDELAANGRLHPGSRRVSAFMECVSATK